MKQEFRRLSKAINYILWKEWDPLFINGDEDLINEYESYVPQLIGLKMKNADKLTMVLYLVESSNDLMGVPEKKNEEIPESYYGIAQKIIDL